MENYLDFFYVAVRHKWKSKATHQGALESPPSFRSAAMLRRPRPESTGPEASSWWNHSADGKTPRRIFIFADASIRPAPLLMARAQLLYQAPPPYIDPKIILENYRSFIIIQMWLVVRFGISIFCFRSTYLKQDV